MNSSTAFGRKIVYLVVLVAMLIPLYLFGHPSDGSTGSGGQLATMRESLNIAESDLGEISPASATMKLVSLGLRGVAATQLWEKAHEYHVKHEWDRLKAALNNIALLQPHYDKVWEHQAHNLAYNVSPQFDDYRQRYEMVREGTEFLTRGVRQNQKAPRLIWYSGWFYGQKLGMSDEKKQFRRLFADDTILHASLEEQGINVANAHGPLDKPDNWLVGQLWLEHGYGLVDAGLAQIRRQTPINFFETGPKWAIKHAEAIEREGILDIDNAQKAWTNANEDWTEFGRRNVPTTSPFTIKLGGLEDLKEDLRKKLDEIREIAGDVYTDMEKDLWDNLQPDRKEIYNQKPEDRTLAARELMVHIDAYLRPDLDTVALRVPQEKKLAVVFKAGEVKDLDDRINKTKGYRTQINFPYWESLTLAEREERTIKARRLVYEAEEANANAELDRAIELYEEAFAIWAEVFDSYPILVADDTADDLMESIRRYMIANDSQELDDDFPLKTFVDIKSLGTGLGVAQQYEAVRDEQRLEEEKQKKAEEEEKQRLAEQAKKKAEQEAKMKAEAEKKAAEEEKKKKEEEKKKAEEAKKKAEAEEAKKAEEEKMKEEKKKEESEENEKSDEKKADEKSQDSGESDESKSEKEVSGGEPKEDGSKPESESDSEPADDTEPADDGDSEPSDSEPSEPNNQE